MVIIESNNLKSLLPQPLLSLFVVFHLIWTLMITAIHFNDQIFAKTAEINDIFSYNVLSFKHDTHLSFSQKLPKNRLRNSWIISVLLCIAFQYFIQERVCCLI